MLMPKKVKHRKVMKGRMRGKATRGEQISFGDFGLKALEAGWITDRQIRMGSGKGAPDHWVAVIKPGRVMYEIQGVDEALAREAFRLAAQKLPIKTKFVTRADVEGGIV